MLYYIIVAIIVIIVLSYAISTRNKFDKLRRAIKAETSNIGIYRTKREDCLNDLMSIAKTSNDREVNSIEKLTAEEKLSQLSYLGQRYPSLQSSAAFSEQMRQASILQADIAANRTLLNGNIQVYNDAISKFPALIVAGIFGFKEEKFIDEDNAEENKRLNHREINFSDYV